MSWVNDPSASGRYENCGFLGMVDSSRGLLGVAVMS
jgi:hypothetical protein